MKIVTLNLNIGNVERKFLYREGTKDEAVIVQALKNSAYSFGRLRRGKELSELYGRLVGTDKKPLIIDAGAKIGASTVYFASAFPGGHLIAIEPEASDFNLLVTNTADLPVECVHSKVAASNGISDIVDPGNEISSYRTTLSGPTINKIYERKTGIALPFIVKIDLEDCEGELFATNPEWVSRTPVIIVQLNDYLIPGTEKSRAFIEYIADCNRDFVYLQDNIFSIHRELIFSHTGTA